MIRTITGHPQTSIQPFGIRPHLPTNTTLIILWVWAYYRWLHPLTLGISSCHLMLISQSQDFTLLKCNTLQQTS